MHSGSHRLVIHAHELASDSTSRAVARGTSQPASAGSSVASSARSSRTPAEIADRAPHRRDHRPRQDHEPVRVRPRSPTEPHGSLRSCGSPPTVDAIDSVAIELGKHSRSANLHLDLRYGLLAPGATDEGDGGSEIELEGRLGDGYAEVQMTRGADSVLARRAGNGAATAPRPLNLNAAEASPDADLEVGHQSPVLVQGGGGDDVLDLRRRPGRPRRRARRALEGGEGDDELIGGDGSDSLIDGPGDDRIEAGPAAMG